MAYSRIPDSIVEKILQTADIVDVISRYVDLRKKGANYWGLSPFKTEKTPSFSVNPDKGIFKCFSTGKGGTMVSFVMEIESLSYPDALRLLADWYHIEVPEIATDDTEFTEAKQQELQLYALNQFASQFFVNQLQKSEGQRIGLPYWEKRGILSTTMKSFHLGYAPQEEWNELTQAALTAGYSEENLLKIGLSFRSEKTGNLIDRFRGRAIFPILNLNGKIAGFGGRILSEDSNQAKYVNSSESAIYNKSKILYGLFQARSNIKTEGFVILVEGYTDLLSLVQAGIKNVVASGGTSLTEDHARLLLRFTHQILIFFDGDEAGVKAAIRAVKILAQKGFSIKVLLLPDNHDPDSFVQLHGSERTREYIKENAEEFVDFVINSYTQKNDISNPTIRKKIIEELVELIAAIEDPVQKAIQQQYIAKKLKISEQIIASATNKFSAQQAPKKHLNVPQNQPESKLNIQIDNFYCECEIIRILIKYPNQIIEIEAESENPTHTATKIQTTVIDYVKLELSDNSFENPVLEKLRVRILFENPDKLKIKEQQLDLDWLINEDLQPDASFITELLNQKYQVSPNWKEKHHIWIPPLDQDLSKMLYKTILRLKLNKVRKLTRENQARLDELSSKSRENFEEEEEATLLKRSSELGKLSKRIAQELGTNVLPTHPKPDS